MSHFIAFVVNYCGLVSQRAAAAEAGIFANVWLTRGDRGGGGGGVVVNKEEIVSQRIDWICCRGKGRWGRGLLLLLSVELIEQCIVVGVVI